MRNLTLPPLRRLVTVVHPSSAVERGTAFETRCMHILENTLSMSLSRVGGKGDEGIDLQGWWWLPTSDALAEDDSYRRHRRMRVLAQCKSEKKKLGPGYLREMEGVLHRSSCNAAHSVSFPGSESSKVYPTVGLFLSASPFTKAALVRALSSPLPFCLLHIPDVNPEQESGESEDSNPGSIVFNPVLANGVLHGEIEARWEHSPDGTGVGRPGLWWDGQRIKSWVPEALRSDHDTSSQSMFKIILIYAPA